MHSILSKYPLFGAPDSIPESGSHFAERLGPNSVMEGALLVEAGKKVALSRIEFADRQTNGVVLAVRLWVYKGNVLIHLLPPLLVMQLSPPV